MYWKNVGTQFVALFNQGDPGPAAGLMSQQLFAWVLVDL
jgi:hypothetical protein